jgi:hypothetical protein
MSEYMHVCFKERAVYCLVKPFSPFDKWWKTERFLVNDLNFYAAYYIWSLEGEKLYVMT